MHRAKPKGLFGHLSFPVKLPTIVDRACAVDADEVAGRMEARLSQSHASLEATLI